MCNSLGELINISRKKKNITQTELAKLTGISQGYLGDLENNRKNVFPTFEKLNVLATTLTSTPEETDNFILKALSFKLPLSLLKKMEKPYSNNEEQNIKIRGYVSAGRGYMNMESDIKQIKIQMDCDLGKNVFAMEVRGDSMEPDIIDGSTIFVDPDLSSWENINNKIAMVIYKEECYVKRVSLHNNGSLILLKSLNKNYQDIIIPVTEIADFKCCGKVVKAIYEKKFR